MNRFWATKIIVWLAVLFFVLILVVLPLLTAILIDFGRLPYSFSKYLLWIEDLQLVVLQIFLVVWVFFVGGCFASFLNVVAWRVPRGRSILGSSHCPHCQTRLAFGDNLPIIGWWRNRGRCRGCTAPIALRYLIAEIVLGTVFLLLTAAELATGGGSLPLRPVDSMRGFTDFMLGPNWDLIRLLVFHLVLVSTLFLFALIEMDGFRIPLAAYWFTLLIGLAVPIFWSDVLLITWDGRFGARALTQGSLDKWLTLFAGAALGFLVGRGLPRLDPVSRQLCGFNLSLGLTLVGLFLGWQSVISVALFWLGLWSVGNRIRLRAIRAAAQTETFDSVWNPNSCLLIASLVHLLSWRGQVAIFQFCVG